MVLNSDTGCIREGFFLNSLPAFAADAPLTFQEFSTNLRAVTSGCPWTSRLAQIGNGSSSSDGSRQRLAAIVESSDDAIIAKDLDGNITDWNAAAEALFGYTAAEIIGASIMTLIPEDLRGEEVIILERIRDGKRIKHFETIRLRKDGSNLVVSLSISPIRNEAGAIIGASKIARDITELRQSQEQQELLLREMNHRVKNLFAVVSSVVRLSAKSSTSATDLARLVDERLISLARAHDLTMPRIKGGQVTVQLASLRKLAEISLAPYQKQSDAAPRIMISGPETQCGPTAATALALLFHEFATNSVKYGALSVEAGEVTLEWEPGETFRIYWKETGGPLITNKPETIGFGNVMVQASVRTLAGQIKHDWGFKGLSITVDVDPARLAF